MHPFYKKLGKKVSELRKKRGLTQLELAEKANLTTAFLSYLENGTRKGSLDAYLNLAECLGSSPETLFMDQVGEMFYEVGDSLSLDGLGSADSKALKGMARRLRKGNRKTP